MPAVEELNARRVTWKRALGICLFMLAIGVLLAFLALIVMISPMVAELAQEAVFWSPLRIARRLLYLAVPLGLLYAGLVLAERKKLCVLYLRRFELNINVISPRYGRGLARDIRLITLDDRRFSPSAAPAADVWFSRLTPVSVLVAIILLGVVIGSGRPSEENEGTQLGTLFGLSFATGIACLLLFSFVLHEYRMWRASRIVLDTTSQLERASAIARAASQWWMRPSLLGRAATVVSVRDELWRSAVQRISSDTNAVVVDISSRSANIDWELACLCAQKVPYVLIAERQNPIDESPGSDEVSWQSDLGDHQIFRYDLADRSGLKQFRVIVASELRRIARPVEFTVSNRKTILLSALRLIVIYAAIFALAIAGAIMLAMLSFRLYLPLLQKT